ncbi:MAG: DNA-binding protein [Acidimicrobiia bacterium]
MAEKLELVGVAEIADLLGVTRQRVHQLMTEQANFPEPVADLAAGKIWLKEDVVAWAETWDRRPGRRPAAD